MRETLQTLKLIQILNLDLGVLLWLSFQIILSGHAITTINIREEKQHGNPDYTLVFSFIRYLLFYSKIFLSSHLHINNVNSSRPIDARVSKVYLEAGNGESAFYVICNMNFTLSQVVVV